MAKNLLIVESPAKAKTIEKILGSDFQVKSCFGHIRDLQKAGMGIDMEKNYEPTYIVSPEKEKVTPEQQRLCFKYYNNNVLAGAKLDDKSKARVAEINQQLAG